MPNQKQDTSVFDVSKAATRKQSNRALPFHTTYEDFGNFNYGATCRAWGFTSYMCRNEAGLYQDPNDDLDPGKGEPGSRFSYLFGGWLFGGWGDYGDNSNDQACINQGISYFESYDEKSRCGCAPK